VLAGLIGAWIWWPVGVAVGGVSLLLLMTHRCPDRKLIRIPGAITAPADGVCRLASEHADQAMGLTIYPRLFSCRVLRSPISGKVVLVNFDANAQHLEIAGEFGTCRLTISGGYRLFGLPVRIEKGQEIDAGEAIGLVPPGGSIILEVASCVTPKVNDGQAVVGGDSIVAIAHEDEIRTGRWRSTSENGLPKLAETG
jgi:hypothetical protein